MGSERRALAGASWGYLLWRNSSSVVANTSWSSSATITSGNSTFSFGELHDSLRDLGDTLKSVGDDEGQQIGRDLDKSLNDFHAAKTGANAALGFAIAMSAIMCILCLGFVIVASM